MKKLAELKQVRDMLRFISDFCKKEDVEIQDKIDLMQKVFDLEYSALEQRLKTLLSLEIEKEKNGSISNVVLKDTILKFKAVDFVMKFYELVSITKIPFREYVDKDLSRDMFTDSVDFGVIAEFDDWLKALDQGPKSEKAPELAEIKSTEAQMNFNPKSEDKDSQKPSTPASRPETLDTRRKQVAHETIRIDRRTLLNPEFSQVDVLMRVSDCAPNESELGIQKPLIITFLFECGIGGGAEESFVRESVLIRNKILNSRSSKKANFRSHKALLKGSRSLSSGKKPSPFKFQTEITSFFEKKNFKWSNKKKMLDKVTLEPALKSQIAKKKQLFNSLLTQMAKKPPKPKVGRSDDCRNRSTFSRRRRWKSCF